MAKNARLRHARGIENLLIERRVWGVFYVFKVDEAVTVQALGIRQFLALGVF